MPKLENQKECQSDRVRYAGRTGRDKSVTIDGIRYQTVHEAAIAVGLRFEIVWTRIKRGWPVDEAWGLAPRVRPPGRWSKYENTRDLEQSTGQRICGRCKQPKLFEEFKVCLGSVNGRHRECRSCAIDRAREKKYGLSRVEIEEMLASQGGRCAICQIPRPELTPYCDMNYNRGEYHVDHDHVTGKVRGILCPPCNTGLGNFKDNISNLRNAISYLEDHGK